MNETKGRFRDISLDSFVEKLTSDDPTPGGGSASALAGATAASLVGMVTGLTLGKKKYKDVQQDVQQCAEEANVLREELLDLSEEDSEAFEGVMAAIKMPKETDKEKKARSRALQEATRQATEVPRQIMIRCSSVLELAIKMAEIGNTNAVSDALVAGEIAIAGVRGGTYNVKINLDSLKDEDYCKEVQEEMAEIEDSISDKRERLGELADEHF